jgi:hypothetical protein
MVNNINWDKKDPDEPLYNAMIVALAIGIVVVIITLILTRPAPESFSELYFNNHTTLPEYVNLNTSYPYSFTIHNLENNLTTYKYTTSIDYYALDYSCEKPELYLEKTIQNSRITETNDPALYIRESPYTISFNYELKTGMNRIALNIVDINNTVESSLIIDHDDNKIYYIDGNVMTPINISKNHSIIHSVSMQVNSTSTKIILDKESFTIKTTPKFGFIQLETIDTYAEFSNVIILRNGASESVTVRIADSQYTEYKLESKNNTITPNSSINLTNYNVKATFRMLANNIITMQLRNTTTVTFNKDLGNIVVNDSNEVEKYYVDSKTINDLSANVNNKSIDIYYNGEFITSISNNDTTLTPIIKYNNVTVNNFYVKSNDEPITINYALTQAKQTTAGLLTVDALQYFKADDTNRTDNILMPSIDNLTAGLTDDERSSLEDYYSRTKISSNDYRIQTTYTDKDRRDNISIALVGISGKIYLITIDNYNQTASIQYFANKSLNKATYNITPVSTNRLIIDVKNNSLSVSLNSKNLFYKVIDKSTDGVVIFDYGNMTIANAQMEDRLTGSVIVFQKQLNINCDPILLNKYMYTNTTTITDKNSTIIFDAVTFNQNFDIAKVQVSLENGQEIHYWVKLI